MAEQDGKRVIEQQATSEVFADDWFLKDSVTEGTTKISSENLKAFINEDIDLSAEAVSYDNTSSGLEADNVQDAIDEVLETAGKVDDVKVDGESVVDENKVANIDLSALKIVRDIPNTPTAIATFSDGADLPMPKLEVGIEPVQDLHGYDNPWVGGAGKNKANPSLLKNGYTNPSNKKYDDTTMAKTQFVKTQGLSTITISATNGNRCYVCYYNDIPNVGDEASTNVTQVATSLPQTITVDSSYTYVAIQVCYNSSGANVSNVQVESGQTATTYEPYSNICPISGWDEVNVTRCGKNLFDYTHFQFVDMGYINGYGVWEGSRTIKSYPTDNIGNEWNSLLIDVSALRSQNVSFSGFVGGTAIGIIDENFKVLYTMGTSVPTSGSVDLSQYPTAKYFVIGFYLIGYDFDNAQFELGTTATTYEPYVGTTTTIPFVDGQGQSVEVFGGSVDVVNGGEQQRTLGYVDLGTLNWTYSSETNRERFSAVLSGVKWVSDSIPINAICSALVVTDFYTVYSHITDNAIGMWNGSTLAVYSSAYTDVASFKQAMSGVQLVYELATPLTIQLPTTVVKSLRGVNNISADSGDVRDGKYIADASLTIASLDARITALENQ